MRVREGGFMLICFCVRTLVAMSYLKLWNYIYIYISSFRPSRRVSPVVSRRDRRRPLSLCPSRRPYRRRRPSSVRLSRRVPSSPSSSSVRPSVHPVVRPVVRPLSVLPRPSVVVVVRPLCTSLLLTRRRVAYVGWEVTPNSNSMMPASDPKQ